MITENGYPAINDSLNDTPRIEYLREHLIGVLQGEENLTTDNSRYNAILDPVLGN